MNRLCASLTLGLALLASAAMGANRQLGAPSATLGGPTLLGQPAETTELPMPAPLSSTPLSPVPEIQYSGPVGQMPVVTAADATLFPCVKYRSTRNIAPCSVPVIVQVPDPCTPRNSCCPRPCVNVEICVPACGCPKVCVTRHGNKTRYDYGKYAVNVISLNGRVVVDYDD
jgi:hypothetical protein